MGAANGGTQQVVGGVRLDDGSDGVDDPADNARERWVDGRSRRRVIRRLALVVSFALAATFTGSVGLFSASAQTSVPTTGSTTAGSATASAALPVCSPGQEAKTVAGTCVGVRDCLPDCPPSSGAARRS